MGACPPPEEVRAAIFQLTSAERRRALPPLSRVLVSDEGSTYRVSVTGEGTTAQKTYSDAARDCARRTRFAAVFAILTLMPPELEPEPEPKPESELPSGAGAGAGTGTTTSSSGSPPSSTSAVKPSAKLSASASTEITHKGDGSAPAEKDTSFESPSAATGARARSGLRLELVGLAERALGVGSEPHIRSFGGELRALLARADFAPLIAFGYAPAAELDAGLVRVDVQRLQAALGVRAKTELGPFGLGGELAVLGALERIAGVGLAQPARGNGFELGLRAGALIALESARVGPLLALHASVFPAPNTFEALPRGEVGHMPHLWLGLAAGVFLGL